MRETDAKVDRVSLTEARSSRRVVRETVAKIVKMALAGVLTVSLVSQFFSREFCGKGDLLLAKMSLRISREGKM